MKGRIKKDVERFKYGTIPELSMNRGKLVDIVNIDDLEDFYHITKPEWRVSYKVSKDEIDLITESYISEDIPY